MKNKTVRFAHWLVIAPLLAACAVQPPPAGNTAGSAPVAPAAAANNAVTAVKASGVSSDHAAAYWSSAPAATFVTKSVEKGKPDGPSITVQAVYDDKSIAMRFEWADANESIAKNVWAWDGTKFTKSGDEDRVQLLWPIDNIPEFATKGCGVACHAQDASKEKWWMGTEDKNLRYDLWHWKSARTNLTGQSDDQWISALDDPSNMESSRHGDAKEKGGYADNLNEAKDGPKFAHASDAAAKFIIAGNEVPIDLSKLKAGDAIPGFVVSPFVGSRGDIAANGAWKDGKWTVVLVRALTTGHDDDVVFTPPKPYAFGLAVTDNNGGPDHTVVQGALTLEWK